MKALKLIVLSMLVPRLVFSAGTTTGASFLQLGDGSRPLALGGAYTAMPGGVDSLYYNPGSLAWAEHPEFSFTHSDWLEDTTLDLASFAQPTRFGTFAASAMRLGVSSLDGRDSNRQATGDFSASDVACLASYSNRVGPYAGIGVTAKYLNSRIASESASTVALDAGATGRVPGQPLWFGASILNMGSGMRFEDQVDRLPLTIALGTAYQFRRPFALTFDFVHQPYDSISELRAGGEYAISLFDFRIGYVQPVEGNEEQTLSASEHIRGGFGIHWSRYRADYALASFGDLGLTQRFTLSMNFGHVDDHGVPHNLQRTNTTHTQDTSEIPLAELTPQ